MINSFENQGVKRKIHQKGSERGGTERQEGAKLQVEITDTHTDTAIINQWPVSGLIKEGRRTRTQAAFSFLAGLGWVRLGLLFGGKQLTLCFSLFFLWFFFF